jgi:chromosome segregation ATPase
MPAEGVRVPPLGPVHVPAPPSSAPVRVTPPSSGSDEVALLQRKVAALVGERNEVEARFERARNESAAADEQVGQMLASIAATEARLRASQLETAAAQERAHAAEERVAELGAEVARLNAELAREREEHDAMRAVIAELEDIAEERDEALTRVELAQKAVASTEARVARATEAENEAAGLRAKVRALEELCERAVAAEHALAAILGEVEHSESGNGQD